jgi:hypothetical protein
MKLVAKITTKNAAKFKLLVGISQYNFNHVIRIDARTVIRNTNSNKFAMKILHVATTHAI